MKEIRAKFVKSTNLEIDDFIPKDTFAYFSLGETVTWLLTLKFCFTTSAVQRFSFDEKTRFLSVYTKNNRYDFELECDCEIEFDEVTHFHKITVKQLSKEDELFLHFEHLKERILSLDKGDEKQFLVLMMNEELEYHRNHFGEDRTDKLFIFFVNSQLFINEHSEVEL